MKNLELRQERHAISLQMAELLNSTAADAMSQWKTLNEKQEALRVKIDAIESTEKLAKELEAVRNVERPNVGADLPSAATPSARALALRATDSYKAEFETFLRTGKMSPAMHEARALVAASSTLVPQGFEDELIIKLKAWGGMTRVCRTISTSTGNPLPWPNADDTTNVGEWLTEAAGVGTADPTFSNVTLGANKLSSKQVKLSVELEQDSAFNIAELLVNMFARRMGTTANAAFTVGDGTSTYGTITGLINALVTATGRNVLALGANSNSGVAGDTALNSIGTDDLSNLITAVDPAYRAGAKFVANQSAWDKLRNLKDKYGRPIWQVSLASGVPDSILGYSYDYNQDIAAIAPGAKTVVFGDFSNYVVRNVLGFTLVRFDELYMANYQRAYQAFARMDGKLLQASAFSYLIHPLS
jgi:HK97 family phage major capsid protein